MKNFILQSGICLVALCAIAAVNVSAQSLDQKTVVFNGLTGKFDSLPAYIKEGGMITVKYINVNPFITKSGITSQIINNKYEDGSSTFNNLQTGAQKSQSTDSAAQSDAAKKSSGAKDSLSDEGNKQHKLMLTSLQKKVETSDSVYMLLDLKTKELNKIQTKLGDIQQAMNRIHVLIGLDTFIISARNQKYNRSAAEMVKDIQDRTSEVITKPSAIQVSFEQQINIIQSNLTSIAKAINYLDGINTKLKNLNATLDFKSTITTLTDNATALSKTYSDSNLNNMRALIANVVNDLAVIMNDKEYTVFGDSVLEAKGDYLVIGDPKMGIQQFRIKTYKGSRIDFSVGILSTFGDVNGWEYTLNKVNDSTTYLVTNKESRQIMFNPVAFVHWYTTRKTNKAWMLSVGAAPDLTTLANTKFLLGFSAGGFSSNDVARRIIFSAGIACGAADVLKAKYRNLDRQPNNNFSSLGNISDSDLTEKAFKMGGYFSITWNLGGTGH